MEGKKMNVFHLNKKIITKGYCGIGLDNPKTAINVGSAIRACGVYGASFIGISGCRYGTGITDTMKHYQQIPVFKVEDLKTIIPHDCVPVAIDLIDSATSLIKYVHPKRAFYIFGAEDATLGKRILDFCRDVVFIPTKGSMNLSATVNVVLYDRLSKQN